MLTGTTIKDHVTINEYIEILEANIKELRARVEEEREIADYWYEYYMELKRRDD